MSNGVFNDDIKHALLAEVFKTINTDTKRTFSIPSVIFSKIKFSKIKYQNVMRRNETHYEKKCNLVSKVQHRSVVKFFDICNFALL